MVTSSAWRPARAIVLLPGAGARQDCPLFGADIDLGPGWFGVGGRFHRVHACTGFALDPFDIMRYQTEVV
jgi:hypothetical protein